MPGFLLSCLVFTFSENDNTVYLLKGDFMDNWGLPETMQRSLNDFADKIGAPLTYLWAILLFTIFVQRISGVLLLLSSRAFFSCVCREPEVLENLHLSRAALNDWWVWGYKRSSYPGLGDSRFTTYSIRKCSLVGLSYSFFHRTLFLV